MLPLELKRDKDGLLFIDDDRIFMHSPLLIDHREVSEYCYYPSAFYRLLSTNDYIIKYAFTHYTRKETKEFKQMLINLTEKQDKLPNIDFPIGYFKNGNRYAGQIIKYYQDGISCEDIIKEKDINLIGKYFAHDEDNIHNMFLLFDEVLTRVYEMFENGIYYLDINTGNIILNDNQVKLIDFDPYYVQFDNKDDQLRKIMGAYILLLKTVLAKYGLDDNINDRPTNFNEAKSLTKKIENNIRRG